VNNDPLLKNPDETRFRRLTISRSNWGISFLCKVGLKQARGSGWLVVPLDGWWFAWMAGCVKPTSHHDFRSLFITTFLTKGREFWPLGFHWPVVETKEVYSKNRLSNVRIFEYKSWIRLDESMEMYDSTNPRFDFKYSNIRISSSQNALHWW